MKAVLVFCALFSFITLNTKPSFLGIWDIGNNNTKVEIMENSGVYSGKIISSDNSKIKVGTPFLKDIKLEDGEWKGQLYNIKKGKWYDIVLEEKEGKKLLVTVDAGFVSKILEWTKQ